MKSRKSAKLPETRPKYTNDKGEVATICASFSNELEFRCFDGHKSGRGLDQSERSIAMMEVHLEDMTEEV